MTEEEDIALIRSAFEIWATGDVERFFALLDDEIEWTPPAYAPEPGPHKGHDAVRRGLAAYFEGFEEFRPQPRSIRPASEPGLYLVEVETHTKGRDSGLEWTMEVFHLTGVRDGKLASLRVFTDRDEALEAAGLTEEAT